MNIIIIISVLCISLLLISNNNRQSQQKCLFFVFIILTVFLGIRYMFGSDYISYLSQYYQIKKGVDDSFSWYESIIYNETPSEPGWVLLNRCFSMTSFYFLVFVLTAIEFYVLYKYIRKYVSPNWYWFSIFLFIVNPSNMLTCISMMRQYLAMTIFLIAIKFVLEGRFKRYLILIILATFIHTSSLILLPIYFIRNVNVLFLRNKTFLLCVTLLVVFWYTIGVYFCNGIINNLLSLSLFQRYDLYADNSDGSISLGFSMFLYILLFYFGLSSIKYSNRDETILIIISLIGLLILPLGVNISLISRLSFYFTYVFVFVCPIILAKIKRVEFRCLMVVMMIMFYINAFVSFINSPINSETYSNYQTIFSADL